MKDGKSCESQEPNHSPMISESVVHRQLRRNSEASIITWRDDEDDDDDEGTSGFATSTGGNIH